VEVGQFINIYGGDRAEIFIPARAIALSKLE
jgi:hypothetical protein